MSRSRTVRHSGQWKMRSPNGIDARIYPQFEHVLLLGSHRSTAITVRPWLLALYSSIDRNADHDASWIARARLWLRTMFATARSSITIVWLSRTSRVDSLCN